jgi:hypothetical protein
MSIRPLLGTDGGVRGRMRTAQRKRPSFGAVVSRSGSETSIVCGRHITFIPESWKVDAVIARRGRGWGRSARGCHREALGTKRRKDQPWRRVLRPRCRPLRDQQSANGCVAQLGPRRLGLPERPGEIDLNPLAVWELKLDVVPAGHEVAVPIGLRDPDAVPVTGPSWTAVVPPACPHRAKLLLGPQGLSGRRRTGARAI